jgi:hypothetical protein
MVNSPIADSLTLSAVPFAASVTFRGADGFANGLLLEWIQLVGSVPGVASLVGTIRVINNATLSARPGTFTLGVFVDDVYVGNATSVDADAACRRVEPRRDRISRADADQPGRRGKS